VDFWNDSCDLRELQEAVQKGAVGATSNPVIVHQAVQSAPQTWLPVLDQLVAANAHAGEDELAWLLVESVARRAAALLAPVHAATAGRKGRLCVQVNPQLYRDAERMVAHARHLAFIAPNIAVKIPATAAGLAAIEELTAAGICINATVSFSVAQALACAAAIERGLARTGAGAVAGDEPKRATSAPGAAIGAAASAAAASVVTIMVGRIEDHLQRVMERDRVTIEPGFVHWAGVAVFKRAVALFRARGYQARLLAAAYRHGLHWSELIGDGVIQSMPYRWWKQFDASGIEPQPTLDRPVEPRVVAALQAAFPDFRRAYGEEGMRPEEFAGFGASIHTLHQFLGGYQQLLELVRGRMLA
jgi:transaldolase